MAVTNGHRVIMQHLLRAGACVDAQNRVCVLGPLIGMITLTFLIYFEKLYDCIYSFFFVSQNALGIFLQDGRTPLHIAAINGDFKSIQLLISETATIEALDKVCI